MNSWKWEGDPQQSDWIIKTTNIKYANRNEKCLPHVPCLTQFYIQTLARSKRPPTQLLSHRESLQSQNDSSQLRFSLGKILFLIIIIYFISPPDHLPSSFHYLLACLLMLKEHNFNLENIITFIIVVISPNAKKVKIMPEENNSGKATVWGARVQMRSARTYFPQPYSKFTYTSAYRHVKEHKENSIFHLTNNNDTR